MRAARWAVLLAGAVLGLWLIGAPYYHGAVYAFHARTAICDFQAQVEAERQATVAASQEPGIIYPELLRAMEDYNRELYETGQACLTSPADYEQAAIDLSKYGLDPDTPIGTLSIPAIDLELPLYLGAGKEQMAKGGAVLGGTSLPIGGMNTNTVIAGHRGYRGIPYFRNLDRLKPGDTIILTNFWETLTYTVTCSRIIEPNDIDAVLIEGGADRLTLLTCHPYTVGSHRLLLFCTRTS